MTACIYGLIDPRDNKIFYVGKTTQNSVYNRVNQHIYDAKNYIGNKLKNTLIRDIISKSIKVKVVILEYVFDKKKLNKIEQKWIRFYKKINNFLTNYGKSENVDKPEKQIVPKRKLKTTVVKPIHNNKLESNQFWNLVNSIQKELNDNMTFSVYKSIVDSKIKSWKYDQT